MTELILRLKGYHYARLLAFLSFVSVIALTWYVILGDVSFGDGEVIFAEVVFILMGIGSGSIAVADSKKAQE